jgi:MFS family permease
VRVGLAASALVSTVMMATLVVGPFYLHRALDLGAATVGLVMSIGPLVAALAGLPAGRLVDRVGTARMTTIGLAVLAAGLLALAMVPASLGMFGYVAAVSVVTASYALFQAANNTAVTRGAPSEQRGVIAGLLGLSRNIGRITGASVMGAVFAAASGSADVASAPPGAVAAGMRTTFLVAALLVAALLVAALLVAAAFALAWRGSAGVAAPHASATPPPRAHGISTAHLTESDDA